MISSWLFDHLGFDLSVQTVIVFGILVESIISCILFNIKTPRRKGFFWIMPSYVVFLFLLTFPLAMLRLKLNEFNRIACGIAHSFFSSLVIFGFIALCYKQKSYDLVLDFVASNAAMILVGKVFSLMLNLAGVDSSASISFFEEANETRDWTIYWSVHIILYVILGLLFVVRREANISKSVRRNVVFLTVISMFSMNILFFSFFPI